MPPRKKAKTTKKAEAVASASGDSRASRANSRATGTAVAQRGRQRQVRGRRGGLESMPNMPLDILVEIFGYIHPRDLLSLARTNRDFRAFLMSKNSAALWKASRQQVEGLPDLPPHLSEPAYANLLFSNHCHGCLKAGSHVLIFPLFVRYCASCRSEKLTARLSSHSIYDMISKSSMTPQSILCTAQVRASGPRSYVDTCAHVPDMERLEQEWLALKDAKPKEKRKFLQEREAYVSACIEVAQSLQEWHAAAKENAQAEQDTTRLERYEAVIEKLREEGWGEDIDQMNNQDLQLLANLSSVKRAVRLTNKGWNSMRAGVIEFMEGKRAAREAMEWREGLKARGAALLSVLHDYNYSRWLESKVPPSAVSSLECAFMPDIRAILEDRSGDATTESITARLTVALPQAITRWTDERKAEMTAMFRKSWRALPTKVKEPLDLATTVLRCKRCADIRLTFPALLDHRCLWANRYSDRMGDFENTMRLSLDSPPLHKETYKPDDIMVLDPEPYGPCLREIVALCGYDPDTATSAEMDAHCEVRLRCRLCATMVRQEIFTWRAAIGHAIKDHWLRYGYTEQKPLVETWDRLPEDLAASAKAVEDRAVTAQLHSGLDGQHQNARWGCTRCTWSTSTKSHIDIHISSHHKVPEPQEDVDYWVEDRKCDQENVWMYATLLSECAKEKAQVDAGKAFFALL